MYKEFLRVRNIFLAFAITVVAIALIVFAFSGHATVNIDTNAHAVHQGSGAAHSTDSVNVYAPGVEISNQDRVPFSILLALAGFVAAIFGTVLGTCLAAENCGHLDIAWTRPASRVAYALRLMTIDALGILAIFAFTVGVSVALLYVEHWQKYLYPENTTWVFLVSFVAYALAWFGLVAALTASVRAKAGAIAGFSWVIAGALIVLSSLNLPPAIHTLVTLINYLNPLLYGSYSSGPEAARHLFNITPAFAISALFGITILGVGAALAQWRRLEA
jgi:hypothetical protein